MKMKALVLCTALVVFSGCATLSNSVAQRNVEKAVELINSGDAEALANHSGNPFIFEGEILFRPVDTQAIWRNLVENGFVLEDPVITRVGAVDGNTYRIFADSDEMKVLFKKYVPEKSTLAQVETAGGTYHLLLGNGTRGYPSILGIAGF